MRHVARPWSYDDLKTLMVFAQQITTKQLAAKLERSPAAVISKANQLRISLKLKKTRRC